MTAGDPARVRRFAAFLDQTPKPFELVSARGFVTITGRYKGVPVSLCAIGMGVSSLSVRRRRLMRSVGYPNCDFLVRETRAVVEGDMAFIRSVPSSPPFILIDEGGVGSDRVDRWTRLSSLVQSV